MVLALLVGPMAIQSIHPESCKASEHLGKPGHWLTRLVCRVFFCGDLWGSSAGQGDTKKKEREIAKKGMEAALAQVETNPSEAGSDGPGFMMIHGGFLKWGIPQPRNFKVKMVSFHMVLDDLGVTPF